MKAKTKLYIFKKLKRILSLICIFFVAINPNVIFIEIVSSTYTNNIGIKGDFAINNDTKVVSSSGIILNIDLIGVSEMRFGNTIFERDSAPWESFTGTKSWTLTSGEGKKTVYAEFKNPSSNTLYSSDDIIYSIIPDIPFTGGLTLWLDSSDDSSITSTSGDISAWNDKSGNNYHAKQAVEISKPNILSDEVNFNGSSDFLYIENLNYTNSSPLDGLLTCGVFKTNHISSSYNDNWAILDFDRSEWFNFYNKGGDYGFSYDSNGTVRDITTSGAGINDNTWHVACASYDNSQTNETILTINGNTEYSGDLEPNGAQIGVSQSTRYGFIGDGSEAGSQNASRNDIYYDGGIGELIYFDTAISNTDRKDLECYLGKKWSVTVNGCPESIKPIASIKYLPKVSTSGNVTATVFNKSEDITITNNSGSSLYTFSTNGTFTFEYQDTNGNTGSTLAIVDWVDPSSPLPVGTGALNESPIITSYSGAASQTIVVGSGVTNVATIIATDNAYNIIGEYGIGNLSGNTWLDVSHPEICSPVTIISHRQDVNGEIQRAPRVKNKTSTGFQVHVDNYNSTIGAISTEIDYLVINSGAYDLGLGLKFEAGSNSTNSVACNASNSPTPNTVNFLSTFSSAPVVLHTISTENDSTWVVSGVNGDDGTRQSEPNNLKMGTVLQRSFNNCTHSAENIDYFAIEKGNYGLLDGSILDATISTDSIASVTASGNTINFNTVFSSAPKTVLVSQLGEDGGNGGYAQIHTGGGITTSQVYATIDEDGPSADRNHTNEVVSSVAFNNSFGQFWEENNLTYNISGGADSSNFTINATTGVLEFIVGKDPNNYTDLNTDGIYEVTISACDSHCNSLCDTQTVLADVTDNIVPIISSTNFLSGSLLPGGNHNIQIAYSDVGVGINSMSDSIELYKWNGSSWGSDISTAGLNLPSKIITSSGANYTTNNLAYGKYIYYFNISDLNGNTSSMGAIFYIDEPEFVVGSGSIDIGNLDHISSTFSSEVTLTVKTIGAGFNLVLNKNTILNSGDDTIIYWDGTKGFGYDKEVYSGVISSIGINELISSQTGSINTSGVKNIYTYKLKFGSISDTLQFAGEYEGSVDFSIDFEY